MTLISTNISRPRPAIAKGISSTALPLRPCSSSPSASALRYDELRSVHKRVSTRTYGVAYEELVGKASPPVERRYIDIGGQNAEGFKSEEKWEELAMKVRRWKMFAVWTLRAEDRNRLRVFHRKCVRTMMGVSRRKQQKTHITNEELNERCKLESMDFYLRAKALRWAGHVVRMPYDRLPRKLFFGWVEHPRARGARLTYGRRIEQLVKDALALAEPDVRRAIMGTSRSTRRRSSSSFQRRACGWVEFARERNRWRRLMNAGKRLSKKLPTSSKNGNGKNGGGGNGKYLSAEVAAAVAADVARALAARDR